MTASALGPWEPLDIEAVVEAFRLAPFRWWISGGQALDLHLGRSWRPHDDTDVGVLRLEQRAVHAFLSGWDLQVAAAGRLSLWNDEPLEAARQQNNVWCRRAPGEPWMLDLTIGEGTPDEWIYRRDSSIHVEWDAAVLHTEAGVPYLAPELQLLFKSKEPRPKDDIDAAEVIPALEADRRERLIERLGDNHPWRRFS